MATDIFNRTVDIGKPLAADATRLIYPGAAAGEDLLVQSLTIQYSQNISRLWDITTPKTYFFAGRTQGQIQMKKVVGGNGPSKQFIKQFGDVCNITEQSHITLFLEAGCGQATGGAQKVGQLTAAGVVIQSLAYSIAAADMLINEEMSIMFARLDEIS